MKKKSAKKYGVVIYVVVLAGVMLFTYNFTAQCVRYISAPHFYGWYRKANILVGKTRFVADIADNEELQEEGLSGRVGLGMHRAMLFVFNHPEKYAFWMKGMFISIDMVWLDAGKKVIHVEKDISPHTFPKTFSPDSDALYVLEFPAGTANNFQIKQGDSIGISL